MLKGQNDNSRPLIKNAGKSDNEELEDNISEKQDNVAHIAIDEEWLTRYGWDIIGEDLLDEYLSNNPGTLYFKDCGSGAFLEMNGRYRN